MIFRWKPAQIDAVPHWKMCLKTLGDHFSSISKILATLWEMPEEYWRPFQQRIQNSGDQIKAET